MEVKVENNNVTKAIRVLKRKLQRDGFFRDIKKIDSMKNRVRSANVRRPSPAAAVRECVSSNNSRLSK